jgi:hypothetical protein
MTGNEDFVSTAAPNEDFMFSAALNHPKFSISSLGSPTAGTGREDPLHDRGLPRDPALLSDRPLSREVVSAWTGAAKASHSPSSIRCGSQPVSDVPLRSAKSACGPDLEDNRNIEIYQDCRNLDVSKFPVFPLCHLVVWVSRSRNTSSRWVLGCIQASPSRLRWSTHRPAAHIIWYEAPGNVVPVTPTLPGRTHPRLSAQFDPVTQSRIQLACQYF